MVYCDDKVLSIGIRHDKCSISSIYTPLIRSTEQQLFYMILKLI